VKNLLALVFDRFHPGGTPPLRRPAARFPDSAGGPPTGPRPGQIVLHGGPLAGKTSFRCKSSPACAPGHRPLVGAPAFGACQSRIAGGLPAGVLIGNAHQVGVFIELDRTHIGQLEPVNQGEVVLGVVALSKMRVGLMVAQVEPVRWTSQR